MDLNYYVFILNTRPKLNLYPFSFILGHFGYTVYLIIHTPGRV